MDARLGLIALALLTAGTGVGAEPPKASAKEAGQPAKRPAAVMLASAEQVPTPTPADSNPQTPVKHRAARVTTCRCGDQLAEQPEQ
jgi:hypothetical protein